MWHNSIGGKKLDSGVAIGIETTADHMLIFVINKVSNRYPHHMPLTMMPSHFFFIFPSRAGVFLLEVSFGFRDVPQSSSGRNGKKCVLRAYCSASPKASLRYFFSWNANQGNARDQQKSKPSERYGRTCACHAITGAIPGRVVSPTLSAIPRGELRARKDFFCDVSN